MNEVLATINKDIEVVPESFSGICESPMSLLAFIVKHISFTANFSNTFIKSETRPTGESKNLIWIKTSWPYGIGVYVEGEWKVDYSISGYPTDIPFLALPINPLKEGIQVISDSDLGAYGIQNTNATAPSRMRWYIFHPPVLS